jgi:hypothetical protein
VFRRPNPQMDLHLPSLPLKEQVNEAKLLGVLNSSVGLIYTLRRLISFFKYAISVLTFFGDLEANVYLMRKQVPSSQLLYIADYICVAKLALVRYTGYR